MTNVEIADNFSLLGKLMDIHGENSFKSKSYGTAAFTIEKLPTELSEMELKKIASIRGIGDTIAQKVSEQLLTGKLQLLEEFITNTPKGILEMLSIKGIGPKKIATIWKELSIETIGELLYACEENRLMLYKGFGEKTQQNIKESIQFYLGAQGSYLYQQIENFAYNVDAKLKSFFKNPHFYITGTFKRQLEVIDTLDWVTTTTKNEITTFFTSNGYQLIVDEGNYSSFKGQENVLLGFYSVAENNIQTQLFKTSCSAVFLESWEREIGTDKNKNYPTEAAIFSANNVHFIPPFLREDSSVISKAKEGELPKVIEVMDIRGIIHSHSKWSDGNNTLEEMTRAAIEKGYEYLVISDHSKTAFYAQGLPVEKVLAQHEQIDYLNEQFTPFKIFKSIESDILNDGNLDYESDILNKFDVVIASIHSNLKMSEEKAMMRLLTAIENPFTSILGHLTGRLLLSRNGYPVDHQKIIDACFANNVVIELNAHPRRLDIDWRWITKALDKNILISINPDAHSIDGFADCKYGVLAAQKAGLTAKQNLSSFSLQEFELFVEQQKKKR